VRSLATTAGLEKLIAIIHDVPSIDGSAEVSALAIARKDVFLEDDELGDRKGVFSHDVCKKT
jgi:hypothetical protein